MSTTLMPYPETAVLVHTTAGKALHRNSVNGMAR